MSSPTTTLNTGAEIPILGIGIYMGDEVDKTADNIKLALKLGYRHLDTAQMYGTEKGVGEAINSSDVPREEIFLVTKLNNNEHGDVREAFEESLKTMNVDYIDLFLMHWPIAIDSKTGKPVPYGDSPTFVETWKEMENLIGDDKKCRAIGVSNFSTKNLDILLKEATIVPAVNQVESHIYFPQPELSKYCKEKGIHLTAYSPLGGNASRGILDEESLTNISEKYGRSKGSVVLSWIVQRGNWSAIPKSSNPERMKDNLNIFKLSQEDFDALSELHTQPGKLKRTCPGDFKTTGKVDGWSAEEMGWNPNGTY